MCTCSWLDSNSAWNILCTPRALQACCVHTPPEADAVGSRAWYTALLSSSWRVQPTPHRAACPQGLPPSACKQLKTAFWHRAMAHSVAAPGVRPGMNTAEAGVVASYLEVLAAVCYAQPQSLPLLLDGSTAAVHAFVDHWLSLAAFRWARGPPAAVLCGGCPALAACGWGISACLAEVQGQGISTESGQGRPKTGCASDRASGGGR